MRQVRIQSPDPSNRRGQALITNAETGEKIESVVSVDIQMRVGDVNIAQLKVLGPEIDVIAEAKIIGVCPLCGHEKEL